MALPTPFNLALRATPSIMNIEGSSGRLKMAITKARKIQAAFDTRIRTDL